MFENIYNTVKIWIFGGAELLEWQSSLLNLLSITIILMFAFLVFRTVYKIVLMAFRG